MSGRSEAAERVELIRELRRETHEFIGRLSGDVQRVHLTAGDCAITVEWAPPQAPVAQVVAAPVAVRPAAAVPVVEEGEPDLGRHPVRTPLVGAFYRRPAPDQDPFVEVGDTVEAGQTLCIVEAMKLMNEIKADRAGKIVTILPADGDMVEFDEVLVELLPTEVG